ncbi:hypothetical protein TeGR_g707 [Tetraparma gracilis]|uniref:EamA domain-containing protein n=1 Tax=Tetraparma gracilis TaxID=2962635 RepID=A0ABQ6MXS7_9STRA|nr:hypothetical protein TeGR_g707 [Tetraparma gracilis]
MEAWLSSSLLSLCLYGLWAVLSKLAQSAGKATAAEYQSLAILTMTLLTGYTFFAGPAGSIRAPAELPLLGASLSVAAGLLSYFAGAAYSAALSAGPGSAVAAISGSYPALAFAILALAGQEEVSGMKVLGLGFALASTACFAMA